MILTLFSEIFCFEYYISFKQATSSSGTWASTIDPRFANPAQHSAYGKRPILGRKPPTISDTEESEMTADNLSSFSAHREYDQGRSRYQVEPSDFEANPPSAVSGMFASADNPQNISSVCGQYSNL